MRRFIAILAVSLSAAPVFAATPVVSPGGDDEVIATAQAKPTPEALKAAAQAAPAPPVASKPLTTQEQIAAFIAETPTRYDDGPRGLLPADRDEDGKRKVHGSMGVSVGTGGYRSAYASALLPVGENTTVGVAVSKTDFGKHGGFYADPYFGGGYGGYGYGGYGSGRLRGGSQQSVALSVMTGGPGRADDTPEGCAPGFRASGRYVEPLWVAGMRDGAHPCDASSR